MNRFSVNNKLMSEILDEILMHFIKTAEYKYKNYDNIVDIAIIAISNIKMYEKGGYHFGEE